MKISVELREVIWSKIEVEAESYEQAVEMLKEGREYAGKVIERETTDELQAIIGEERYMVRLI